MEEVIAHLIRTSGYSSVTPETIKKDPNLITEGNKLKVKGRGAKHQVDVLGEMDWILPFNFPLRLIVEAKFRECPTGIDVIRNQIGIINDINENFFVKRGAKPRPRYRYNSVIISASKFTLPAIDMAIAHQIQLVDLSGDEHREIRDGIESLADSLADDDKIKPEDLEKVRPILQKPKSVDYLDKIDRLDLDGNSKNSIKSLIRSIDSCGKLFVGMSRGGFMLLLNADSPEGFVSYAKNRPTHKVDMRWPTVDNGHMWKIKPLNHNQESGNYELNFRLPERIHKWIFENNRNNQFSEAINQKEQNLSKISIYYKGSDRDYVFNLKYKDVSHEQQ